jgi:type IV secretion system protein TrbL
MLTMIWTGNPTPTPTPGNGSEGGIGGIIGGITNVINGAAGTVSYWSDPWGNTFKALQTAAEGMSKQLLPALTSATMPDLDTAWFINAYRISFATAIFVAVVLLIPQVVRTARGVQAGRELVDSAGLYFGAFLLGAMFGPALGIMLINFFHALTDVFVSFGVTGSVDTITSQFTSMITSTDPTGIAGGVPVAVFLMLCMVVGLFLVMLVLLVQLVTLYFAGVLFPLGLVWIIDPSKRKFGTKIGSLWFGILAAHPLLFLLLGLAFSMMANQVSAFGNNFSLQSMVNLVVAVIALFIAALSPLLLMKFAPVIPMGSGGSRGPAVATGSIGPSNMTDAVSRFGSGSSNSSGSGTTAVAEDVPQAASLSEASASAAAPSAEAIGAGAVGTTAGAAGAGAAGAAGGGAAAGGMVAAGAAETATGAGAAIGIPTLIAAGGMMAAGKAVGLAQKAGEQATSAMEEQ